LNSNNRYYWWTGIILTASIYIILSEVVDRYVVLFEKYNEISEKRSTILSPEEYAARKTELEHEHQRLLKWALDKNLKGEQGQGALFEYMNTNASNNNVIIQSIIPQTPIEDGKARNISFTINATAKYHDIALFLNQLEIGSIPIQIQNVSIRAERLGNPLLTIALKGQARLFTDSK